MSNTKKSQIDSESEAKASSQKYCFVIMPISDAPGYDDGHFDRIYEEIIKPAVMKAGFEPKRADGTKQTHVIMLEILKSIVEYDMAICDLSSLNPNVMYELGIRQMAHKPVLLIKDEKTRRIFDISLMSDIAYDSSLRVDKVRVAVNEISEALVATFENNGTKANSLIDLLSIDVKIEKKSVEISKGESVILNRIEAMTNRLQNLENTNRVGQQLISDFASVSYDINGYPNAIDPSNPKLLLSLQVGQITFVAKKSNINSTKLCIVRGVDNFNLSLIEVDTKAIISIPIHSSSDFVIIKAVSPNLTWSKSIELFGNLVTQKLLEARNSIGLGSWV